MKKKSKNNGSVTLIVIILLVVAVVGYYCWLVNRPTKEAAEQDPELSAAQEILLKDISMNYPPTVKEVMKHYNEVTRCLYNEECSQEDLEALVQRERDLMDSALLANNEWGTHVITLSAEVTAFRESGRKITGSNVGASTDVYYFEKDGHSFARIPCSYTVMQGTDSTTTMHIFLLRKDSANHWKIYGWNIADNVDMTEEE